MATSCITAMQIAERQRDDCLSASFLRQCETLCTVKPINLVNLIESRLVDKSTIFKLSPPSGGGPWTESLLYVLSDLGVNGVQPEAGLACDRTGNLYGTTLEGETVAGVAFQLASPAVARRCMGLQRDSWLR